MFEKVCICDDQSCAVVLLYHFAFPENRMCRGHLTEHCLPVWYLPSFADSKMPQTALGHGQCKDGESGGLQV